MFYSPTTSIFRILNEINDFKEIQNGESKMAALLKYVIVTSLLLLMTTNMLSGIRILSDIILVRL